MHFNDLYWHDAIIKNISIDRSNPGMIDEIHFDILFPDQENIIKVKFTGVYCADLQLNFGIVAEETILQAFMNEKDQEIDDFKSEWNGHLDNIKLKAYIIHLNSTGGKIKILAVDFKLMND